jgi:dienelactone hydrolase
MLNRWLDGYDKRRAAQGNEVKEQTAFILDAQLAFQEGGTDVSGIDYFCRSAVSAAADPSFFDIPAADDPELTWEQDWIEFRSSVTTDVSENNIVKSLATGGKNRDHALIVFHHWNARKRYGRPAKLISQRGVDVFQMAMPYHFERSRPNSIYADYMLSPSLGRTIQSVRQAVLDGRKLIRVLEASGYKKFSVLGISLGSWVAGLVAANDPAVKTASLYLTAGSLADMVWTGRATEHIRSSLAGHITVAQLNKAWLPLNLENYARQLARADLKLQIVVAQRDTVVPPDLAHSLITKLRQAGARPDVLGLNCGHYSFSLPPYILRAGLGTLRLMAR